MPSINALALFADHFKEIASLAAIPITIFLNRLFRIRPKLIYSVRHSSNYLVDEPLKDGDGNIIGQKQIVRTASIVSENTGLSAAKKVEYTFNWKPPIFNVYPGRSFTEEMTGMGRWSIKLDSLAPGETFVIEILAINQDLPVMSAVRSEDVEGVLIHMTPQRVWPSWFNRLALVLFLIGIAASVYLIIAFIQWVTI